MANIQEFNDDLRKLDRYMANPWFKVSDKTIDQYITRLYSLEIKNEFYYFNNIEPTAAMLEELKWLKLNKPAVPCPYSYRNY